MRELTGSSRSSHTFSYAGLRSLTDLSSGVVRWFLQPASDMFHEVLSVAGSIPHSIPVSIQDKVIFEWSRKFHDELANDPGQSDDANLETSTLHSHGHTPENYRKLRNLVDGVGQLFRARLLDRKASEQRIFSFVLSDEPNSDLEFILGLGVRLGYFHKVDIASKSAIGGRRPRYILARRLGPYYKLDVSGHAAHVTVKSSDLNLSLDSPKSFVTARLKYMDADGRQTSIDFGEQP